MYLLMNRWRFSARYPADMVDRYYTVLFEENSTLGVVLS